MVEFYKHGEELAKKREQVLGMTKLLVEKARKRYKEQVKTREAKWSMRWAKRMLLIMNNVTLPKGLIPKFMSKIGTMFHLMKRMFNNIYKLKITAVIKLCPTFHIFLIKPFEKDTLLYDCKQVIIPPLYLGIKN